MNRAERVPYDRLYRALRDWVGPPVELGATLPPIYARLQNALNDPMRTSGRDLAGLFQHVLRQERERGSSRLMLVPKGGKEGFWPSEHTWRRTGVATDVLKHHLRLSVDEWVPEWSPELGASMSAAFREDLRRIDEAVPGDPFLHHWVGYGTYSTPAQKQAVRAALYMPCGDTLVVLLPTGTGKSLVAILASLITSLSGGTSVMVVPTIALALDQQRAIRAIAESQGFSDQLPEQLAYIGAMKHAAKRDFHERIRLGEQKIMIISPEALLSSCSGAVMAAAESGRLNYLVVDEAHLVAQWGDDFRPEYQALGGFWRELLRLSTRTSKPRALLMTATLTTEGLATLDTVFTGEDSRLHVVAGLRLRSEPEYVRVCCESAEEQTTRLLEVLDRLPRPMIVYTTMRRHAERLFRTIAERGYGRIDLMHGETRSAEREQVVSRWAESQTDIVVATSAFGVGVDNPHVRSVVHACFPENVDRYYQEVGRGGRDGRASVALMLFTAADERTARGINAKRHITVKRGLERWSGMLNASKEVPHSGRRAHIREVSIDAMPSGVIWDGSETRKWNVRTLNLMARAGLIRLRWSEPPQRVDQEADPDFEARIQQYFATRRVEIIDDRHRDEGHWRLSVEPVRLHSGLASSAASAAMASVAYTPGRHVVEKVLQQTYSVSMVTRGGPTVEFQAVCYGMSPEPPPLEVPSRAVEQGSSVLAARYAGQAVRYCARDVDDGNVTLAIELALEHGFACLVDFGLLSNGEAREFYARRPRQPFFLERPTDHASPFFTLPALPTLTLFGPKWVGHSLPAWVSTPLAPTLTIFPEGAGDPYRSDLPPDDAFEWTVGVRTFIGEAL